MIQAIETSYKGCRFRSRLEARYAVFFDALGIEWQYEPQGFEIKRYNHDYCENEWQGSCEEECVHQVGIRLAVFAGLLFAGGNVPGRS